MGSATDKTDRRRFRPVLALPLSVAGAYAIVGLIWIASSDWLAHALASDAQHLMVIETYKGWGFVLGSAALLWVVLQLAWARATEAQAKLKESRHRLHLAVSSAGGGIWERDLETGDLHLSRSLKAAAGFGPDLPSSLDAWGALIHSDDAGAVEASTAAACADPDRNHDVIYRIRHKDGGYRWLHSRGRVMRGDDGRPKRLLGVAIDITSRVEAEAAAHRLADHDMLTGLPNRGAFQRFLEDALRSAANDDGLTAVVVLDLDGFRDVNGSLGFAAGDAVLRSVARNLAALLEPGAALARTAADEFALAVPALRSAGEAQRLVERIGRLVATARGPDGEHLGLTASIGVALHPMDGATVDEVFGNAHLALKQAIAKGRDTCRFYASGMDGDFRLRAERARDLRTALEEGAIDVVYQPIIDLSSGRTCGFEALARWCREAEGPVRPDEFIALAEDIGLIDVLGRIMLRRACAEAAKWPDGDGGPPYVAVNLSQRQLDSESVVDDVSVALQETGLAPERLVLEVTENALTADFEAATRRLERLSELGASIAIDDFGTGHSSLTALQRLPVARLKVDKSFVAGYGEREDCTAIVDAVLGLASTLGLQVVAEGVETEDQLERLRRNGCGAGQGYLFARPMTPAEAARATQRIWFRPERRAKARLVYPGQGRPSAADPDWRAKGVPRTDEPAAGSRGS